MRVYFDTCCFIDMIKTDAGIPTQDGRQDDIWYCKRLLDAARDEQVEVFTSSLTAIECTYVRDEEDKRDVNRVRPLIDNLFWAAGSPLMMAEPSIFTREKAKSLAWDHGVFLKAMDMMHVASALTTDCKELLTFDERIGAENKKIIENAFGLRIIRPADTNALPDNYKQSDFLDER